MGRSERMARRQEAKFSSHQVEVKEEKRAEPRLVRGEEQVIEFTHAVYRKKQLVGRTHSRRSALKLAHQTIRKQEAASGPDPQPPQCVEACPPNHPKGTIRRVMKTMPTVRKSSRVGAKDYKSPAPLRFKSVADARTHIKKNKLKVKETHSHRRGARIQVVDQNGKPRTISIELPRVG